MTKPTAAYSMVARYYEQDRGFIATSDEFPGPSAFGETRQEAFNELEAVLELAVEEYRASGLPLPSPRLQESPRLPSGEFRVRLPRRLHAELATRAELDAVSQNTLVVSYSASGLEGACCPEVELSSRGRGS